MPKNSYGHLVAISLVIHLIFLLIIRVEIPESKREETQEIIIKIRQAKPKKTQRRSKSKQGSKLGSLSLGKLGVPADYIAESAFVGNFGSKILNEKSVEESGSLILALKAKIKEQMFYPGAFVRSNIKGVSTVRLVIDQKGVLCWDMMKVESSSSYLKVLMMRILKASFRTRFHFPSLERKQKWKVDLSMTFSLPGQYSPDDLKRNEFVTDNSIHLIIQPERPSYGVEGIQVEQGAGVMVDFAAIAGNWKKKRSDKKTLRDYRNDPNW